MNATRGLELSNCGVIVIHYFCHLKSYFLTFLDFFIQNQIIMTLFGNVMSLMRNFGNKVEFYRFFDDPIPT